MGWLAFARCRSGLGVPGCFPSPVVVKGSSPNDYQKFRWIKHGAQQLENRFSGIPLPFASKSTLIATWAPSLRFNRRFNLAAIPSGGFMPLQAVKHGP